MSTATKKDNSAENYELLRKLSLEVLGLNLFGVADILPVRDSFLLPSSLAKHYPVAISLGKEVLLSVLEEVEGAPTPLYFHHYRQLNNFLDRAALQLAAEITARGFMALPIAASQIIDWNEQKAHVSHKKIGQLAGLGWLGRNNLLVNPVFGARIRLVTVLTNFPLKTDQPLPFGCGPCRRCQLACPARAIKETPEQFDHLGCYAQLKEFRRSGLVSQFICGVCVKACYGQKRLKDYNLEE